MQDGAKWRGYSLIEERVANTCKLYFVRRGRKRYVVKEYTNFRFLTEESLKEAEESLLKTEERARRFLEHLQNVAELMQKNCRRDGPLNIPAEIFREGVYIYKVTRMEDAAGIRPSEVHEVMDRGQQDVFLRMILTQLESLQKMHFVHGDIKPENLIIGKKGHYYTASLIDYETGFTVGQEDSWFDIEYTPEYASPEMLAFQRVRNDRDAGEDALRKARAALSCSSDIFSAGCMFLYFLTGQLPGMNGVGGFLELGNMMEQELPVQLPPVHPVWRVLIREMLRYHPAARPQADQILTVLLHLDREGLVKEFQEPFELLKNLRDTEKTLKRVKEPPVAEESGRFSFFRNTKNDREYVLFHEADAWLCEKMPRKDPGSLAGRLKEAAERRRSYRQNVLKRIQSSDVLNGLFPQVHMIFSGPACFVMQEIPKEKPVTIEQFAAEGLSAAAADRVMLEILSMTGTLHQCGLLQAVMEKTDIWIRKTTDQAGKDPSGHPFLIRPQRFFLKEDLPRPEDVDVSAGILAPELCMYLGMKEVSEQQGMKQYIGPWTDLFSLGLIYHLLLCGEFPDTDGEYGCLGYAAQGDGQTSGLLLSGSVDERRKAILRHMLAFEPEQRAASCEEIVSMIRGETEPESKAEEIQKESQEPEQDCSEIKLLKREKWKSVRDNEFDDFLSLDEAEEEEETEAPREQVPSEEKPVTAEEIPEEELQKEFSDIQEDRPAAEAQTDDFIILEDAEESMPEDPEPDQDPEEFELIEESGLSEEDEEEFLIPEDDTDDESEEFLIPEDDTDDETEEFLIPEDDEDEEEDL